MPGSGYKHSGMSNGVDHCAVEVLMYHQVVANKAMSVNVRYSVSADQFRDQMRWLDKWGFTTITFDDYLLHLDGVLNLPKKAVILTFDDGYLDNYENALPVLKEYGMKAVFFVLGNREMKTNTWDHARAETGTPLMNDQQIINLHRAGFEIGAHSITHPRLTEVSREIAWKEISHSRITLEALLNAPVRSFAYPYGAVNIEVKRMVAEAGYSTACGVYTGPVMLGKDLFDIRRITILNTTSMAGFALRLLLPLQYCNWVWRNGRGYMSELQKKFTQSDDQDPNSPTINIVQSH